MAATGRKLGFQCTDESPIQATTVCGTADEDTEDESNSVASEAIPASMIPQAKTIVKKMSKSM